MLDRSRTSLRVLALGVAMATITAAAVAQGQPTQAPAVRPVEIRSWGYQLQGADPAELAKVPYDAIVIDYSRDGRDETAFSAADVARLKVKPDGTARLVLAYMSIGEAENYRFYWKSEWNEQPGARKPGWHGKANGEWGGNFAVRYWDADWQAIIIGDGGYLDRILGAGFDGVWLDKVDSALEDVAAERATATGDMIAFVKKIGDKGRAYKPGFLVFPQNGEAMLADPGFRAVIDGFGKESLLYGEDGPRKPNSPALIEEKVALLNILATEGKPVLAVEYLDNPEQIDAARAQISEYGFLPHFGNRLLGTMRVGDQASVAPKAAPKADVAWAAAAAAAVGDARAVRRDEIGKTPRVWNMLVGASAVLGLIALMWMTAAKR